MRVLEVILKRGERAGRGIMAALAALVMVITVVVAAPTSASGDLVAVCGPEDLDGPPYMIEGTPISIQNVKFGRYLDADNLRRNRNVDTAAGPADTTWWMAVEIFECGSVTTVFNEERRLYLDQAADGNARGVRTAADTSRWQVLEAGGGTIRLRNVETGRYLDADGSGANYNVNTSTSSRGSDRQWRLVDAIG